MRILTYTADSPALDLALEEAIQIGLETRQSPPTWRFWQASVPAVILGTGQECEKEVLLENIDRLAIPLLRRHSGGGTVLIGPGTINYSGFYYMEDLPGARSIQGAMDAALVPIRETLRAMGLNTKLCGLSDITTSAPDGSLRKIAGNAQARKRYSVLVHGTLLIDPDWKLMEETLRFPTKTPEYRAGRSHRDFLTSLRECAIVADMAIFIERFRNSFGSQNMISQLASSPLSHELEKAQTLALEKYGSAAWSRRR